MQIKKIPTPESVDNILDIAFKRASKEADKTRVKNKDKRAKKKEHTRVQTSAEYVIHYLGRLEKLGLRIVEATDFEKELLDAAIGLARIDKALNNIARRRKRISGLESRVCRNIRMGKVEPQLGRKEFYGRLQNELKKIKKDLEFLGEVLRSLRDFPTIKEGYTIVFAGMPNVGKSSIMRALTRSTPDIKPYPFTTKNILVGYIKVDHRSIQVIDTPGLLDRSLHERNPIEKKAVLALKRLGDRSFFVFDASEYCGYPLKSQVALYSELLEMFEDLEPVANKSDITDEVRLKGLEEQLGRPLLRCTALTGDVNELKRVILESHSKESIRGPRGVSSSPR